jgi:uncharacterized SAM-binding protein YcdF (DUF218 family)
MELTPREKFIILVDNDCIGKSDAIILLEGDGYNRYSYAAQLWKEGYADTLVFSGGAVNYEYGSYPFNDILPMLLEIGVPQNVILHEANSLNTQEQANEVFKLAVQRGWSRLILVASHFHQYRAYLTFLKCSLLMKSPIIIFNAPVRNIKWFKTNKWGNRYILLDQEFDRIIKYHEFGHLATYEEAIEYQIWKEKQV